MATGVMAFPNFYHWRFCSLALAWDEKGATRVKTTPLRKLAVCWQDPLMVKIYRQ